MKLIARLGEEQHEIEIERKEGKVFARVDGREYELEASRPEENVYLLKLDGLVFEVFVSPDPGDEQVRKVKIAADDLEIRIFDPKRLRGADAGGASAEGAAEIRTAMPGKVVRVLKGENDEVAAGEGVIVVEAMKMQNEMKSPKDGVVSEIRFREGETVNAGDVLAVIE